MKVLGISPLDKDATVSLVEDGQVLFAAGEERFSRIKHHAGFPSLALDAASHGQTTDIAMLLCPHFFEHGFTYLVVPLVAALVYQVGAGRSEGRVA